MTKHTFLILLLPLFLFSCINQEGEGGTAMVQGYIYNVLHADDVYNFEPDTFPAAKTDVYLIYGDDAVYGDKMEAAPDGFFQFKYLTKGTYRVYAYCSFPDGRREAVYDTVFVSRGAIATTKDIYIHEGKMLDKSYVKGTLLANYYDKNYLVEANVPAVGERVFIRKKDALYHFDDIRAGLGGVFMFQKLDPGEYEIFVLTEDANDVITPIFREVLISDRGVIVEIDEPIVIRINT